MDRSTPSESTPLMNMEEGRCTKMPHAADTASSFQLEETSSASIQAINRTMETPELVLQEVYYSARDIARLDRPLSTPVIPPENFGFVLPGVFRSAYPQSHDYAYLQGLKLKTVITLVQKDLPEGFASFMQGNGIRHQVFGMEGTKKAEIPLAMMKSIISVVMDRRNHPLLIHCNHGRHRTGCAVGIVRKLNGWDTASILAEYDKYAAPKPRATDVEYLTKFKLSNLKHVVARKMSDPQMSVGQFLFLLVVTVFGLCVWMLTLRGLDIPTPLSRQPSSKDES